MPDRRRDGRLPLRRVYILPNLFTALNLFLGWMSVVRCLEGELRAAGWLIFAATLLDGLDGAVARLTKSQSDFGAEFDSLSDLVSFGLAPAVLAHRLMEKLPGTDHPRWVLGVCGLYAICGALRLARYNVQAQSVERRSFTGLPIPAAAGMLVMSILLVEENILDTTMYPALAGPVSAILPFIVFALALLMVSEMPYPNLMRRLRIGRHMSFDSLVSVIAFGALFIALKFDIRVLMLWTLGLVYVLGFPLAYGLRRWRRSRRSRPA